VLLVERNAIAALDLVQSAYLIEQDRIVLSGNAEALRANPDIQEAYLAGHKQVDYHALKHYRGRKR
jgi:branched-chain amino acid transport system ATP-binding protein